MKRALMLILILLLLFAGAYFRPIPAAKAIGLQPNTPQLTPSKLVWPTYGQAAYGALGYGVLVSNNDQKAVPIASITKVITALCVLQKHPLKFGEQGPTITLGDQDVTFYQQTLSEDGSNVVVQAGEKISEYQALQAMLLPSGDNMAESLAVWGFGAEDDYLKFANSYVNSLGMDHTHLADASGLSASTVSNASDLILLAEKTMTQPVLADIVGQTQAMVPVAGEIKNLNYLLGQDGINGIKTGNTSEAGGCILLSAKQIVGDQTIQTVGVILGASDLNQAENDGHSMMLSMLNNFQEVKIAQAGQKFGTYSTSWGLSESAVAAKNLSVVVWKGKNPQATVVLNKIKAPDQKGQTVGQINILNGQNREAVPLILAGQLNSPSFWWRIFHI